MWLEGCGLVGEGGQEEYGHLGQGKLWWSFKRMRRINQVLVSEEKGLRFEMPHGTPLFVLPTSGDSKLNVSAECC